MKCIIFITYFFMININVKCHSLNVSDQRTEISNISFSHELADLTQQNLNSTVSPEDEAKTIPPDNLAEYQPFVISYKNSSKTSLGTSSKEENVSKYSSREETTSESILPHGPQTTLVTLTEKWDETTNAAGKETTTTKRNHISLNDNSANNHIEVKNPEDARTSAAVSDIVEVITKSSHISIAESTTVSDNVAVNELRIGKSKPGIPDTNAHAIRYHTFQSPTTDAPNKLNSSEYNSTVYVVKLLQDSHTTLSEDTPKIKSDGVGNMEEKIQTALPIKTRKSLKDIEIDVNTHTTLNTSQSMQETSTDIKPIVLDSIATTPADNAENKLRSSTNQANNQNIQVEATSATPLEAVTTEIFEQQLPSESIISNAKEETARDPIGSTNSESVEPVSSDHSSTGLTTDFTVPVRKCCETSQFYSLNTQTCEAANSASYFQANILSLINSKDISDIQYISSTMKTCPETGQPPSIASDITNSSHVILDSGEIVDLLTLQSFNLSQYCLELVGVTLAESSLTLVYCLPLLPPLDYYDYNYHIEPEFDEDFQQHIESDYDHVVRKCCGQKEYYDTALHKCTAFENYTLFNEAVQGLSFETKAIELKIISSRIHECPQNKIQPKVFAVDSNAFRLLHTGELIETATGFHYNYSHYCLEMVGNNQSDTSFTMALCSHAYIIPKCCPLGLYFDEIELNCLPLKTGDVNNELIENFLMDAESYSVIPAANLLQCQNTFPVEESAANLSISKGKLCNKVACFEKESYCIDFMGHKNKKIGPSAFYCRREYFVKCCKEGYILSEKGCIPYTGGKSVLLEHLTNTRTFVSSFDTKRCRRGQGILLDDKLSSYVIWWVSNDGSYLTVSADPNKKNVENYCIDDFKNSEDKVGPSAYVCESDVNYLLPNEHHFLRYSESGSLGKCCPENFEDGMTYFFSRETKTCELMPYNATLKDYKYLRNGSFTSEHFHDFPQCPKDVKGYHSFPFQPGLYDYAEISSKGVLKVVSKDGKCVQREDIVGDRDYCIEYIMSGEGDLTAAAFLCAYAPVINVYTEKFTLVTALLGISSVFLFLTLIFLFTVRVRRGFVTVRKVNTLAGRILVSFISSHLLGFIAFSLTQHENLLNKEGTAGCYVLAGFVQFFNLATFCWNTSICLESLLLTIDINISKCLRYFLHSLWAWGFPLFMTILMYVMDAYRDELPCGVITPKIGVLYCFLSSNDATLVYFYIPIFITLVANIIFIFGGKAMRKARLRRLEKGGGHKPAASGGQRNENNAEGSGAQVQSGMRTHQHQNTKTESIRIVLWTGGTWFMELAGFVLTRYIIRHSSVKWYEYLWYIPTSLNALRGVGIFAIIVLTPEKRKEIRTSLKRARGRLRKLYERSKKYTGMNKASGFKSRSTRKSSFDNERKRNISVTTMISTLSSSFYNTSSFSRSNDNESMRKASIVSFLSSKWESLRRTSQSNPHDVSVSKASANNSANNTSKPTRKIGMIRSISQFDRRASTSSGNSFFEELEMEEENSKRRCSVPLPKLQEEESYFDRDEETTESKGKQLQFQSSKIEEEAEEVDVREGVHQNEETSGRDIFPSGNKTENLNINDKANEQSSESEHNLHNVFEIESEVNVNERNRDTTLNNAVLTDNSDADEYVNKGISFEFDTFPSDESTA